MQASKFIITREDLNVDPVTLVTDGLKIGRLPSCELLLNHPTVSRLHAGINSEGGRFYLYNFSHSSGTTLNGRVVGTEAAENLVDGDVVQIGPFFLHFESAAGGLSINVMYSLADGRKRAVGFKLSDGMEIPEELADRFKFARQKSKLAGTLTASAVS